MPPDWYPNIKFWGLAHGLYLAFQPKHEQSIQNIRMKLQNCTTTISAWIKSHFLKLNGDKTELLVITTPSLVSQELSSLNICGAEITMSHQVRDLRVPFDSTMKLDAQVKSACKKTFYQIHLIYQIRKNITEDAARTQVHANVTPLLGYCNGLLVGLPSTLIDMLQRVQNCAARVIKQAKSPDRITPLLKELHWLPVKYRIEYKITLLTFKALHGLAPEYLRELIHPYHPPRSRTGVGKVRPTGHLRPSC